MNISDNVVVISDVVRQQGECKHGGRRGVCEGEYQRQDDRGAGSPEGRYTVPYTHIHRVEGGSVKEYIKDKMTKEQDLLRATHTHKDKHTLSGGNEGRGG